MTAPVFVVRKEGRVWKIVDSRTNALERGGGEYSDRAAAQERADELNSQLRT